MVDIWKYANALPKVLLKTIDGKTFCGNVIEISDAEEDEAEDSMVLELEDGRIMGFYPSEIKRVETMP